MFLERVQSNVFENDQAHSFIAVFANKAIFKVFYLKRLISILTFGNENGGVVKGEEFSGSVVRRLTSRIECLKNEKGI